MLYNFNKLKFSIFLIVSFFSFLLIKYVNNNCNSIRDNYIEAVYRTNEANQKVVLFI